MKTVVANWKMNLTVRESIALARGVLRAIRGKEKTPPIVLCASFNALSELRKVLTRSKVKLGAQNVFWEEGGAFTGEVSTRQLTELGCKYVILGHSERRHVIGETDEMINKKVKAVLAAKLIPVLCVGEPAVVRKKGFEASKKYVVEQLQAALDGVSFSAKLPFYIAYEPIWSISTSFVKQAEPKEVVEMHEVIRSELDKTYGHDQTQEVHIIYGGSISKGNAYQFLREPAVEGVLVGGASLKLSELSAIIKSATDANS